MAKKLSEKRVNDVNTTGHEEMPSWQLFLLFVVWYTLSAAYNVYNQEFNKGLPNAKISFGMPLMNAIFTVIFPIILFFS